jgi:uncharacterized membrane protein YheB (UPF0754 family)
MLKTTLKILCAALMLTALLSGSIAVAAAERPGGGPLATTEDGLSLIERLTARVMEMQNRDRVEALLNQLVENNRISQGEANQILNAWDAAHPDWMPLIERLTVRIMEMQNRDRVAALLDQLVLNNRITQGEANQILNAWDAAHPDWMPLIERLTARIMEMQNRDRVEALLAQLVENNRITQGEANQILNAWDAAHPDWMPLIERLTVRIMEMQNRDRVAALLDQLVLNSRITQGEANQILNAWDAAHPGWQPPSTTST